MTSVQDTTPVPLDVIAPGCVCLAPFIDSQGMQAYYRARIEDVYPSQDEKLMAVVSVECPNTVIPYQLLGFSF